MLHADYDPTYPVNVPFDVSQELWHLHQMHVWQWLMDRHGQWRVFLLLQNRFEEVHVCCAINSIAFHSLIAACQCLLRNPLALARYALRLAAGGGRARRLLGAAGGRRRCELVGPPSRSFAQRDRESATTNARVKHALLAEVAIKRSAQFNAHSVHARYMVGTCSVLFTKNKER